MTMAFVNLTEGNDHYDGTDANETVNGLGGDDAIFGNGGNDVLNGGDGNDGLSGGSGANVLNGGAGSDGIYSTSVDTIDGGTGQDTLQVDYSGVSASISFTANAAPDAVSTFVGQGTTVKNVETYNLKTGSGNDSLTAGNGNDHYYPGSGTNSVHAGTGGDYIQSDGGADTIDGGGGTAANYWLGLYNSMSTGLTLTQTGTRSFVMSNGGSLQNIDYAAMALGSGDDTVSLTDLRAFNYFVGLNGPASVIGGAGIDTLNVDLSAKSADVSADAGIYDSPGSGDVAQNITDGQWGVEEVTFSGIEKFNLKTGSGADWLQAGIASQVSTFDGGAGQDLATIDFSDATAALSFTLNDAPGSTSVIMGQGSSLKNVEAVRLTTGSGADSLTGGAGDDILAGGGGDDTLNGGGGGDQLYGGLGTNVINGGLGNDNIYTMSLNGSTGVDTIDGGAGSNVWIGNFDFTSAGLSFSQTGARAFSLSNGSTVTNIGLVQLKFGYGNDSVNLSDKFGDNVSDYFGSFDVDGGSGNNTLNLYLFHQTASVSIYTVGSTTHVNGLAHFQGQFANFSTLVVTSGSGDDSLAGTSETDVFDGGVGNDNLDGGGGVDTVSYDSAPAGVSVSLAISGQQHTGGAGNDTLLNFENLTGSRFSDTLMAGAGGSVLTGGLGNDLLYSGVGNDTLDGGAGVDAAAYASALGGVHVSLLSGGAQNTGGGGTDTLISIEKLIGSNFADTLIAAASGSTLNGGPGGDDLISGPGSDILNGGAASDFADYALATVGVTVSLAITTFQNTVGAGSDELVGIEKLVGSGFDDTLTGDAGVNVLYGQGGADTINGGAGGDILYGGAGNDLFVLGATADSIPTAPDTISDFLSGHDRIDLHLIDADTGVGGDQAFHLGGGGHAGDLVVGSYASGKTEIDLYVDNNASADAAIWLTGDHHLMTATDFVL